MPEFSQRSLDRLNTCHTDLQLLFSAVVAEYDCSILCGHRSKGAQELAVMEGKSKVHWPDSKHSKSPSFAIDVAPYPIDWDDLEKFCDLADVVFKVHKRLKSAGQITHRIRWGGDWDMDGIRIIDQTFNDLVHYELIT